jgi:hypothetical protein
MVHRFEVSGITAEIAGEQPFALDAHLTTRGRALSDVVTVSLGGLIVYCYDAASVYAFADAWNGVLEVATDARVLPERARFSVGPGWDRHHAGIILRVSGTPAVQATNVIPSAASPTGVPHAKVTLDRLTVHAYDLTSIRGWSDGWGTAAHTAERIWPDPDTFEEAENRERGRIAPHRQPDQGRRRPAPLTRNN